jgi:hypothetical protein
MEASDHVPRLVKYGDNQVSVGDLENVTAQSYPLTPGPQDEATWPTGNTYYGHDKRRKSKTTRRSDQFM